MLPGLNAGAANVSKDTKFQGVKVSHRPRFSLFENEKAFGARSTDFESSSTVTT